MIFLLFGAKGIETPGEEKLDKSCPSCKGDLEQMHLKRWFTFFFIPIFPFQTIETFFKCVQCSQGFKESIKEHLLSPAQRQKIEASMKECFATTLAVCLNFMAAVDGKVDGREKKEIDRMLAKCPEYQKKIQQAIVNCSTKEQVLERLSLARNVLPAPAIMSIIGQTAKVLMMDGRIDQKEEMLMKEFLLVAGMPVSLYDTIIKKLLDVRKNIDSLDNPELRQIAEQVNKDNLDLLLLCKEKRKKNPSPILDHLKKYRELGVPLYIQLGVLAPVRYDARKASCCFLDEFSFPDGNSFTEMAKNLWADYRIFTGLIFVRFEVGMSIPYVFFFKELTVYSQIMNLKKHKGVFDQALTSSIGQVLGYPDCCIREFSKKRSMEENIETKMRISLQKEKNKNPLAFFAGEFFPCLPGCKRAMEKGKQITNILEKVHPKLASAFQIIQGGNMEFAKNANVKYVAVMRDYEKDIEKVISHP